ncbi:MAG: DUF5618 family protein [Prevotellaceae bacterium]|jgi:hypothetical protein|nr:DUF5618 family protein [Prevotellaceae bacterium]
MATMHKNSIKEAQRYLDNAKEILSKNAGKDGAYYTDKKYVKLAGHAAWSGVLVALDGSFKVKENKPKGRRVDFKDYLQAVGKVDKKLPSYLSNAYETLHLVLGYDGNLNYKVVQSGIEEAKNIIDIASKYYKETA